MMGAMTRNRFLLVVALLSAVCAAASAATQLLDSYYRFDVPCPQFKQFWRDMSDREAALNLRLWDKSLAGSAHVYLLNTGTEPLVIEDVVYAGISLKRAIAFSDQNVRREADPASVFFSDLKEADRRKFIEAGGPIWWRVRPRRTAPGEVCEVAVRFRTNPPGGSVKLVLAVKGTNPMTVTIPMKRRPRFESISFSSDLTRITAFCSVSAKPPTRLILNGKDVTAGCTIRFDPKISVCPIVARLSSPLKRGSYCCLQAVYPDGAKATELIKVWSDEPAYGMWGGRPGQANDTANAKAYFDDLAAHNINTQMEMIGSDSVIEFLKTPEGRDYIATLGIKRTVNEHLKQGTTNPYLYFLADEPESADFYVKGVPPQYKMGCLTQGMVDKAQSLHEKDPVTPSGMNINYTFRPHSTYAYGLIPDILMCDPYYQARLGQSFARRPRNVPLYTNAKYIYAMTALPRLACMPHPLHMVLYAVSAQSGKGVVKFRFPTPEEKRIEVYYALAAGAKQISYWWYTPVPPGTKGANGCGADDPQAKALWNQIGLLGAEFGTVSRLIADGCVADLEVTAPEDLWVRTLLSGADTVIVLCVNENYASDRLGTVYQPIEQCRLEVSLPAWIRARDVFEVTWKGTRDVRWDFGRKLDLQLDATELTRMIVVTSDPGLRSRLQERYQTKFAAKVAKLTGGG